MRGESTPRRKPHPDPVHRALELLEVAPSEAVIVGDSPHDVQAGREAGVATCGVTYGLTPRAAIEAAQPQYLIDALQELQRWVE